MPIPVTCPTCLTRFSVSDKFAGKSGPCPKCKSTIKIPELSEQVVIHAPVDTAPKDSKGRSIFKPIRREEVRVSLPVIVASAIGSVAIFGTALGFGISGVTPPAALLGVGSLVLAIPLVLGGYWFLRDDDLQGYSGRELIIRCAICSVVFAICWWLYRQVPMYVSGHLTVADFSPVEMAVMIAIMIALGTSAAVLALELEVAQGVLVFMLYFVITFVLVWMTGTPLSRFLPGHTSPDYPPPIVQPSGASQPSEKGTNNAEGAVEGTKSQESPQPEKPAEEPPKRDIPQILQ